jgi:hypothetical protein
MAALAVAAPASKPPRLLNAVDRRDGGADSTFTSEIAKKSD